MHVLNKNEARASKFTFTQVLEIKKDQYKQIHKG